MFNDPRPVDEELHTLPCSQTCVFSNMQFKNHHVYDVTKGNDSTYRLVITLPAHVYVLQTTAFVLV